MSEPGQYDIKVVFNDADARKQASGLQSFLNSMSANDTKRAAAADNYIKASTIRTVADQKKAYKELTKALEAEHRQRMAALKGDLNAQVSEHKRHNSVVEKLEKDHQAKMQAMRSQTATGRAANRFNMASMASGGGLSGAITGVTAALGPMGMAIGAVIGGAVSLFSKATANAIEFEKNTARIKTLLSDKQAETLPNALNMLAETSAKTGKPMAELQDSFYQVLSAAPALANNLAATASITEKAAKTAMGLGAGTDEVTLAAVKLSNALGLNIEDIQVQDKMFNMLAQTQNAGIMTGQEMASTIARTGPLMGFMTENAEHAMMAIGAMNAQMTAGGVSAEETQAKINALAREMGDSKIQAALLKAGLKGINDQGKVTDWVEVMKSGAKNVDGVMKAFSSSEAKQAFLSLSKNGGEDFQNMVNSMVNAGGTYERMYSQMSETTEGAQSRMSAAWDNMLTTIGQSSGSVFGKVFGFIADGITWLTGLFEGPEKAVERTQAALLEATQTAADMQGTLAASTTALSAAMSATNSDQEGKIVIEQFDLIKAKMGEIQAVAPIAAQEIQKILNDPSKQTAQGLAEVNKQLAIADEFAKGDALIKSFEATDALVDQLNDKMETANVFKAYDSDIIAGMERDKMKAIERRTEAEAAYAAVMANNQAGSAEADKARAAAQKELVDARHDEELMIAQVNVANQDARKIVDQIVEQEIKRAELSGKQVDMQDIRLATETAIKEEFISTQSVQDHALTILNDSLAAAKDTLATRQNEYEQQVLQAEMAAQTAGVEEYVKDLLVEKGVTEKANNEQKIIGLEAASAALAVQISDMEGLIQLGEASVTTDAAKLTVMNALIDAQNELNKAQGSELVAKKINLDGLADQLKLAKAQVGALKEQKKQIDGQVDSLRKAAAAGGGKPGAAGGGGKGRGGKSDAEKEEEKRKKEEERREKELHKERMRQLQNEEKAQTEALKAKLDAAREEAQRQKELTEAMRRIRDEVKKFGEELEKERRSMISSNFDQLGSIIQRYITSFKQTLLDVAAIKALQEAKIRELEGEIGARTTVLQGTNEDIGLQNTATAAGRELIDLQRQLEGVNQSLKTHQGLLEQNTREAAAARAEGDSGKALTDAITALESLQFNSGALREFRATLDALVEAGQLTAEQRAQFPSAIRSREAFNTAKTSIGGALRSAQGPIFNAEQNEAQAAHLQGQIDRDKITADDLKKQIDDKQKELDQLNADLAKNRGEIVQLENERQKTMEEAGPVAQLVATVKLLDHIVQRRKEIADLEESALKAQEISEFGAIALKIEEKKAALQADMASGNISEADLMSVIAQLREKIAANADLTAHASLEERAHIEAIEPLLIDRNKLEAENSEIDHGRLIVQRLQMAKMREELQTRKDIGTFVQNDYVLINKKLGLLKKEIEAAQKLVDLHLMEQSQLDDLLKTRKELNDQLDAEREKGRQNYTDLRKSLDETAAANREKTNPIEFLKENQAKERENLSKAQFVTDEERINAVTDLQKRQNDELAEAYKKKVSEVVMEALGMAEKIAGVIEQIGDISLKALKEEGRNFGQDFAKLMKNVGQTTADAIGKATGLPIGEAFGAITALGEMIVGFVSDMILLGDENYKALIRETNEMERQNELMQRRLDQLKAEQEFNEIQMGQFKARNDMAEEQLAHDKERAAELLPVLRKLGAQSGISFGSGSFKGASHALQTAQRVLLTYQAEYDANNKRLEDDLSQVDRERREARKRWLEEQMQSLEMVVNGSKEYLEIIANADELQRQMFQDRLDQVDHEQKMADLHAGIKKLQTGQSDEDFEAEKQKRDIKFLEKKKKITDELLAQARKDYKKDLITRQELNAFEEQALQIELDILQAKRDQNAENSAAIDKIREMNMERQALILKSRNEPLSADEIARIRQLEDNIIAEMTTNGATPEAIAAARQGFENSIPSFAEGTASLAQTGLILAHQGERIVPKMENEAQTRALMGMQIDLKRLIMAQMIPGSSGGSEMNVNLGGVYVTCESGDPREIGHQVGVSVVSEFAKLHDEMHRKNPFGR